jgi:hypothetical protein
MLLSQPAELFVAGQELVLRSEHPADLLPRMLQSDYSHLNVPQPLPCFNGIFHFSQDPRSPGNVTQLHKK